MSPEVESLLRVVDECVQRAPRDGQGRLTGVTPTARTAIAAALQTLSMKDFAGFDGTGAASSGWRELEVFRRDEARACLFFVPPGVALPLHDHPGMTVFLRTLAGRLELRSWDWVPAAGPGLAREISVAETTADDPACVLLPDFGNLHAIAARGASEPAVFLDLFVPYYDDVERPCTCFREAEVVTWRGERLARLEAAPELDPDAVADRGELPLLPA